MQLQDVAGETALTFVLLTDGELPDAARSGHIRCRVSRLLFADLRFSYGQ